MRFGSEAQCASANRRVFVVDSDDINRSVLQFMLEDDHDAHELGSIVAAEEKATQRPPDLVIVAAMLVAVQGAGLIPRWRVRWPALKVLVICEACDDACIAAAKHAGADDTLTRPFVRDAVRQKVDRWLVRKMELELPVEA